MSINRVILNILTGKGDGPIEGILRDLADAKKMLCSYGPNGEPPLLEPDHETRIKVIDALAKLVDKVRPRGSGVNVNVAQTNNTLNVSAASRSFEERLRNIRDKNGLRTGAAEVVEPEPEPSDDEAEEFDEAEEEDIADAESEDVDEGKPTEPGT